MGDFSGQQIGLTYDKVLHEESDGTIHKGDGTAGATGKADKTGGNEFLGNQTIEGDLSIEKQVSGQDVEQAVLKFIGNGDNVSRIVQFKQSTNSSIGYKIFTRDSGVEVEAMRIFANGDIEVTGAVLGPQKIEGRLDVELDPGTTADGVLKLIDTGSDASNIITYYRDTTRVFRIRHNGVARVDFSDADNYVFDADLETTGTLTKSSGTFLIDHPLNPTEKDLYHGFVEAPRYDLIYRGRVNLVDGKAEVDIDSASNMSEGTFDALTKNATVTSLQNQNGFSRVKPSEIIDGKFTIECEDEVNDEIAWVVIAERDDDFIRNEDKRTDDDGSLVPEWEKNEATEVEFDDKKSTKVKQNKGKKGYPRHPKSHGMNEDELFSDEKAYQEFLKKEREKEKEMEKE